MFRLHLLSLTLCLSLTCVCQSQAQKKGIFTDPAKAGPDFVLQGEYVSTGNDKMAAQVVALGKDQFDVYVLNGGLPGAGWDQKKRTVLKAKRTDDSVTVQGKEWTGTLTKGKLMLKHGDRPLSFKKVHRDSPTVGAKPPKGAVVLFAGANADQWAGGKIVEENLLHCGCRSKERFGLGKYHIEFRTPFRPTGRGQGRGNSGVYIVGREIQVLDSFALEGKKNECGAYYGRSGPSVNMCYPPLTWQTYDVDLKTDKDGKVVATVLHNGVKIHDNFPIGVNANSMSQINLQNHGNPVVFRNIWHVPANKN